MDSVTKKFTENRQVKKVVRKQTVVITEAIDSSDTS